MKRMEIQNSCTFFDKIHYSYIPYILLHWLLKKKLIKTYEIKYFQTEDVAQRSHNDLVPHEDGLGQDPILGLPLKIYHPLTVYLSLLNSQMRFENCNGVKGLNGSNQSEPKTVLTGRMPYVIVRESAVNWWTTVQGLNHYEVGRGAKSDVTGAQSTLNRF